jgi:Mor family transcriptional regulator
MTISERTLRNSKIVQYRLGERHTALQTAHKFNISINQIFVILRKYKNQYGKQF